MKIYAVIENEGPGYSNDGLPAFSRSITEKESRRILSSYEYRAT